MCNGICEDPKKKELINQTSAVYRSIKKFCINNLGIHYSSDTYFEDSIFAHRFIDDRLISWSPDFELLCRRIFIYRKYGIRSRLSGVVLAYCELITTLQLIYFLNTNPRILTDLKQQYETYKQQKFTSLSIRPNGKTR